MQALRLDTMSEDDYLVFENASPEWHEYVAGEIFAMSGASLRHATLTGNVFVALKLHLKGTPCRVFANDIKLRVAHDKAYYYPDLIVTCDPRHAELTSDQYVVEAPTLVIEVLSESTQGVDPREKMVSYRKLASLKEYVLVSQTERLIEVYRRTGDVGWGKYIYEPQDTVDLVSVSLNLGMDDIYDDTGL
jgi:Uma2 family endonuclease